MNGNVIANLADGTLSQHSCTYGQMTNAINTHTHRLIVNGTTNVSVNTGVPILTNNNQSYIM